MLKYLKNNALLFVKGMAIGTAVIIPGVSGGTIAFLLGIYDQMIEAITGLRRHFVKSLLYLLPILIGALLAVLALVFPISWAFDHFPLPLVTLFAGLIIGGLPSMYPSIQGKMKTQRIIVLILAFVFATGLGVLSVVTSFDASQIMSTFNLLTMIIMIVVGMVGATALVMPGISGSMLLLVIGFYAPLTNLISGLMSSFAAGTLFNDWTPLFVILSFVVGLLFGFILISLLMRFLLIKYKIATYFGIFGFILGSLVALYYNHEVVWMYGFFQWWHIPIAIILLALGYLGSFAIAKYGHKPPKETK